MIDYEGKNRKAIPYGVANYETIRDRNFYYVDKTGYLREIEKAGMYLFFIRPRRFGKTLFLSMMETYYDVNKKNRFEDFFKGTAIFENPTPEKNSYLILKFNFSEVASSLNRLEESFYYHVKNELQVFLSNYENLLKEQKTTIDKELEKRQNPSDLLSYLLTLCKISKQKLYLIIDEYDNFANTILSTAGIDSYESLTHGEGFFRDFFKVIKAGTSGSDAPIDRLFLTGVSPITLDDVTSGFNIGENISIDKIFNDTMGFDKQEVTAMIDYYRQTGAIHHETGLLLEVMSKWYNHYRFSKESDRKVFNSTQVLHFLKEYMKNTRIPEDLIDRNLRSDYGKIKHLLMIDKKGSKKTNGNFSKLKTVIENGFVTSRLEKAFPVNKLERPENFISLLFYFGLLTIAGIEKEERVKLAIPNETVKKLFYEYISEAYTETDVFSLDPDEYSELMDNMAYRGKWRPLFDYIARRMEASLSLRDLISGEKAIQAFLHVYLGLSNLYMIHSEREFNKGFADLMLEPFSAKYEGIKYSYLIEIKYIKSSEEKDKEKLQRLKIKAEEQLRKYGADEKLGKSTANTTLIKLALIFSGHRLLQIKEVE